jgi:Bacterial PH domain
MSTELIVTAKPIRSSRLAIAAAVIIVVAFGITALVMTRANAGAHFHWKDQVGTAVLGVILAGLVLLPTRPRLRADATGVYSRAYLGAPRFIPWELVVDVQFPQKLRFARLVLPADETVALYAVQRSDRERSVEVMRGLRQLFAEAHPAHA